MENEFWKTKKLEEMDSQEWESICHKCGQCCYQWYRHPKTQERVKIEPCYLLDEKTLTCKDYCNRHKLQPECIPLTPQNIGDWLPEECSYRLLKEGKDLPEDHPLRSTSSGKKF